MNFKRKSLTKTNIHNDELIFNKDGTIFSAIFESVVSKLIQFYIYQGFDPDNLYKVCVHMLSKVFAKEDYSLAKHYHARSRGDVQPLEYETLIKYNLTNNAFESTRGNFLGLDKTGKVILGYKEGWIPKYPHQIITLNNEKAWALETRETYYDIRTDKDDSD